MADTSPSVSVVIPVFNRPAMVRRAIESVLAQTCQDFEILVVDDASTDGTASAVEAIADRRITVIRHDRRRGGSASRNSGIRAATAPYVAFLDSDDEWLPEKLQRQLQLFRTSASPLGLVYTGVESIRADGTVRQRTPKKHRNLARTLLTDNVVGGASVGMVRMDVLTEVGGFDEALASKQDVDLWLRICERFSADFVPEPLVRAWETTDGDRISLNVDALIRGRHAFFQKHRHKLIREGVEYVWLRQFGWTHHRYRGDLRTARALYTESIRAHATAPLTYVLLAAACIPVRWMHGLARCKHRIARLAGIDPEAWSLDMHVKQVSGADLEARRRGGSTPS